LVLTMLSFLPSCTYKRAFRLRRPRKKRKTRHMERGKQTAQIVRFGVFAVDLRSGELFKSGMKIRLQEKPFQLLAALLERPGEPVMKEELRERLWAADVFVDFDSSLKIAVNKLRQALGDSAKNPAFIETVARRGYRFIAPVEKDMPQRATSAFRSDRVKVAVLPFSNISDDSGQEFFSDGVTEEVISQLGSSNPQQLAVIARGSAMKYKRSDKSIDEIGQELGVDYVIEGSVVYADSRVRITGGLVQVSDQTYVWAKSYERDMSDVLTLQRRVAEAMAQEIRVALEPPELSASYSQAAA
jgi:TolB-like protein